MPYLVAIVGRPNVGKSSLFNRIIGDRFSITDDVSGVTRDRIYAHAEWLTKPFRVIDTGGIEFDDAPFLDMIKGQSLLAIDEADTIVFVVDATTGLTATDQEIAKLLYASNKNIIVAVNKADNLSLASVSYEFYSLGLGDPIPISSHHGIGIGDLLDQVISYMPDAVKFEEPKGITLALIGRPNVGKSSLTNAILGEDRVIVSPISGTTTDSIDTTFTYNEDVYTVIDTAGIKKRGRIYENTDRYSLIRAISAMERAEVALILLDASEGIIELDKTVLGYALDLNKAIVIVVNKWDKIEKDTNTMSDFTEKIRQEFKFVSYAEIVFVSAINKSRIESIFPVVKRAYENHKKEISTSILNEVISDAVAVNPPKLFNNKQAKINYVTQIASKPPTFLIFVNDPKSVHFSYERYLENQLRQTIDFTGTPIKLIFRKKE